MKHYRMLCLIASLVLPISFTGCQREEIPDAAVSDQRVRSFSAQISSNETKVYMESDPYSLSLLTRWEEDDEIKVYVEERDHFIELPASKVYDVSEDGKRCFFSYALPAEFEIPEEGYRIICLSSKAYQDDIKLPVNKDKWVISMPLRRKNYRPSLLFDGIIKPTTTSINFEFLKAFEVLHVKNQSLSSCDFSLCGFQTDNRWFRENYAYVFRPGEPRTTTSETGPADTDLFESDIVSIAPLSEAIIISEYVPYDGVKISNATMVSRIDGKYVYSSNTISSDVELLTQHAYHMYVEWDGTELKFSKPHEYVDLGLSVKWAKYNIGAQTYDGTGDYFLWGETDPRQLVDGQIDEDTYSDYKWWIPRENAQWSDFPYMATKYCIKNYSGYVDGKKTLDPEDDAATKQWGVDWRTPYASEWQELIDKCTWERASVGQTEGYIVRSNVPGYTDQWIFLPDTHNTENTSYFFDTDDAIVGSYMSLDLSMAEDGYFELSSQNLVFGSNLYKCDYSPRVVPAAVRPVQVSEPSPCHPYSVAIRELTSFWGGFFDVSEVHMGIGDKIQLTSFVLPENASNKAVTWSSSDPSVLEIVKSEDLEDCSVCVVKAISGGVADIIATTVDGGHTDVGCITVDYVDLGLSVRWSPYNLSADYSHKYGNYYAWGETHSYGNDYLDLESGSFKNKTNYTWGTYQYCRGTDHTLTKYCTDNSYGNVDNITMLDASDDISSGYLEGNWRNPTKEECMELVNDCTWTLSSLNGVAGYNITGPNGNTMFLPFAGEYQGTSLTAEGSKGYYLTSTLNADCPSEAFALVISNDGAPAYGVYSHGRETAITIRPVLGNSSLPTSVEISKDSIYCMEGGTFQLYSYVSPSNARETKVTWSSSNPAIASVDEFGTVHGHLDGVAYITASLSNGSSASCRVKVMAKYVDMGLSVKWASFNLGSSAIGDIGNIYAWGETCGMYEYDYSNKNNYDKTGSYQKKVFKWGTYKYSVSSISGKLAKYNWVEEYGTVDIDIDSFPHGERFDENGKHNHNPVHGLELDLSDDAATQKLGGSYHTPTIFEWNELLNNTIITLGAFNGVEGYFLTSTVEGYTDKFVFLPINMTDAFGYSKSAVFWTSSFVWEFPFFAHMAGIGDGKPIYGFSERYLGECIRPVKDY